MLKNFENQRSLLNYGNKIFQIKSVIEKLVENFKDLISPLNSRPRKPPLVVRTRDRTNYLITTSEL